MANATGLFEKCKAAIDALNQSQETNSANQWLMQFEGTSDAWSIADALARDMTNPSYRFFGARILYNKIQTDFKQLDSTSATSLMESLVNHIIRLSQAPALEMNVCRYMCLALSALALQLNMNGIVSQMLTWLNPILSTQPIIILELLLVLPEECYNERIVVSHELRDLFSQQLCQSSLEIFGFLYSLMVMKPGAGVELQILKCVDRWVYNIDMPVAFLVSQPVFMHILEGLNKKELFDEAIEVVITVVRRYGYTSCFEDNNVLFPILLQHILPLSASMWTPEMVRLEASETAKAFNSSYSNYGSNILPSDDDDDNDVSCENEESMTIFRGLSRVVSELAEAYMVYMLEIVGDLFGQGSSPQALELKNNVNCLISQIFEIVKFKYNFNISRIPLKFCYEMSEYMVDFRKRCDYESDNKRYDEQYYDHVGDSHGNLELNSKHSASIKPWVEYVFTELLQSTVPQMLKPSALMKGTTHCSDSFSGKLDEWLDLLSDCCHVVGGDKALTVLCTILQTEMSKNGSAMRWDIVEACLCGIKETIRHVEHTEERMMPQLIQVVSATIPQACTNLVCVQKACIDIVGNCDRWLKHHPESLPQVWQMLINNLQVSYCSNAACKAMMHILSQCASVPNLPVMDLHTMILTLREIKGIALDNELLLLEGLCTALTTQCLQQENSEQQLSVNIGTVMQPLCVSLSNNLNGSIDARSVIADVSRMTTVVMNVRVDHNRQMVHPVIAQFPQIQPLLAKAIESIGTENVCEKVCRFFKYLIRHSTSTYAPKPPLGLDGTNHHRRSNEVIIHPNGFLIYLESMAHYLVQLFQAKQYSAFIYCASILVTEFGVVNKLPRKQSSTSIPIGNQILDQNSAQLHDDAMIRKVNLILFNMCWSLDTCFFGVMNSLTDFENKPDLVEEYFYLLSRVLQYCPVEYFEFVFYQQNISEVEERNVEAPSRLVQHLHAALNGLNLRHKEAQKGILSFIQKTLNSTRSITTGIANGDLQYSPHKRPYLAARMKVIYDLVTQQLSVPLLDHIFNGLSGGSGSNVIPLDEDNGCILDLLWSLRLLLQDTLFQVCCLQISSTHICIPRCDMDCYFIAFVSFIGMCIPVDI